MTAVDASAIAESLIRAYDDRALVEPLSAINQAFDLIAGYDVLAAIAADRRGRGWKPAGRKIGFTNRTLWEPYGVDGPFCAPMWDRTVQYADDGTASFALDPLVQPRIEPEVVFGLSSSPPASDDAEALLASVEWMAPGFEVVQCPYAGWRFAAPDCVAASGLHGGLVVGRRVAVTDANRATIADALGTFDATLSRSGEVVDRGNGANVLDSPALALGHLVRILAGLPQFEPLAAGEVITTGTVTNAWPVAAGEAWTSDYGALGIDGLTLTFTFTA